MAEEQVGVSFVAQVYDCRTKKDGSGRLTLDFGADAIDEIQRAQAIALKTGCAFQVALIPFKPFSNTKSDSFEPDPETGEIDL